ncbi:acyltransferase [Maricaulis sp.]|uniref:acyltransferase family protein n=1 Tax=Maricaulis sp. TaxID=1486257 RepID=UPI000C458B82|nr:acyltransferase [Maricaulis sp.]MAC90725.1 acyltransferase [Maricaulis sp.]
MTTLGQAYSGRDNRFTLIRLVLASMVMLEHIFVVVRGPDAAPAIAVHGWSIGYLAVNGFFILSGFLIADSLERRQDLKAFLVSRSLRIWPALIVLGGAATLFFGPVFTSLPIEAYLTSPQTWLYPLHVLLFADTSAGPAGVYADVPAAGEFSATLWTLRYEVLAYAGLALVFFTRFAWKTHWLIGLFLGATVASWLVSDYVSEAPAMVSSLGRFGSAFLLGVITYRLRAQLPLSLLGVLIFLLAALAFGSAQPAEWFWNFALASAIFWIGLIQLDKIPTASGMPDWSYGIYIWHYPLMQAVMFFDERATPLSVGFIAVPITLLVSAFSWSFFEKPALSLKKWFSS